MTTNSSKFTGIVYVHGIGQQSRYEELSRLIQSFEDYADIQDLSFGEFHTKIEPSRVPGSDQNVGYVSLKQAERNFHFYEVYWAPLTSSGTTGLNVALWLMSHMLTPINILSSSWHTRQRLRRSYLYMLWERRHGEAESIEPLRKVIHHYNDFCERAIHTTDDNGKFSDFIDYLAENAEDDAEKEELQNLAHNWRSFLRRVEISNYFILLTIIYFTFMIPILTIVRMIQLSLENPSFAAFLSSNSNPTVFLYGLLSVLFVPIFIAISHFLRVYIGDVQLWATYEETNDKFQKHEAILHLSLETMTHVLNHTDCERVILVTHSLGTTIAYDTLLSIGRHNRALENRQALEKEIRDTTEMKQLTAKAAFKANVFFDAGSGGGGAASYELGYAGERIPAEKIEYFITMGSPIDKIHYFFESRRGKYRPYEMIVDDIRGDIGSEPFTNERHAPNFRWLNFWQPDDVISGALTTPNNREVENPDVRVNNIRIESYRLPAPGRSHVGYFTHNKVIRVLYNIVFRDKESQPTEDLRKMVDQPIRYPRQWLRNSLLAGTWSLLFAMFFDVYNVPFLHDFFTMIFLSVIAIIIAVASVSVWRGKLHPFKKNTADKPSPDLHG